MTVSTCKSVTAAINLVILATYVHLPFWHDTRILMMNILHVKGSRNIPSSNLMKVLKKATRLTRT
jgi:hypothetical protein